MSSVYLIDYYSTSVKSFFHNVTPVTKIVFLLIVLFSIIVCRSVGWLVMILFLLLFLAFLAKLPPLKILKWALLPVFFSLFFALSQIGFGNLPFLTIFRAYDAAVLLLFVAATTPYNSLFSVFGKISPFLSNLIFIAYRFLFLIADEAETKFKILKIRGGYSGGLIKTLKNVSFVLGKVFIHSFEKGEQVYKLLLVRGYKGVVSSRVGYKFRINDFILVSIAILIFFVISQFSSVLP
jgi:cobalt/nickel transport system permease protein